MNEKASILIVEDDLSVRCAIEDMLRMHGFTVRTAGNERLPALA
jgi:DNA-binding NtrC family response regulator